MGMEEEEEDVEDDTYDTNMDPKPNKVTNILILYNKFYCSVLPNK